MWSRGGENKNTQERKKNIYTNLPHGAGRFSFLIYEIVHIRLSTRYTNIQCKYYRGIIKQHQIEEEKSQKKRCLGGDRKNCATKRYHTKHFPPFNHLSTFSLSLSLSPAYLSVFPFNRRTVCSKRQEIRILGETPSNKRFFRAFSSIGGLFCCCNFHKEKKTLFAKYEPHVRSMKIVTIRSSRFRIGIYSYGIPKSNNNNNEYCHFPRFLILLGRFQLICVMTANRTWATEKIRRKQWNEDNNITESDDYTQ